MIKRLFTSTAVYAIAPQLPRLVNLFMLPLITPYLSPRDYGINGILFAYLGAFDAIQMLGLSLVITNSFFQEPDGYFGVWKKLFGFLSIWSLALGLLLLPVVYYALPKEELNYFWWVALLSLFPLMFLDTTITFGTSYMQLSQMPIPFASISTMAGILAVIVNYFTIVVLRLGYFGFLISNLTSQFFVFIVYAYVLVIRLKFYPTLSFSFAWLKQQLTLSVPTIPHYYSAYFLNISDRVLLDLLQVSTSSIGLYAFSYNFGTYFSTLGRGFLVASTPLLLTLYKKQDYLSSELKARELIFIFELILLAFGFVCSLWIREIVFFLSGNAELRTSYSYAIPVIMAYTYFPIYAGAISKLRFSEKTAVFWKISFFAATLNVILNVLFIPLWGVAAAAMTTFVSYMYMALSGYLTREFREINKIPYYAAWWVALTCILLAVSFLLKDATILVKTISTLIALGLSAFLFRQIRRMSKVLTVETIPNVQKALQ